MLELYIFIHNGWYPSQFPYEISTVTGGVPLVEQNKLKQSTYFTMTATPRSKEQGQRGITKVYDLNSSALKPHRASGLNHGEINLFTIKNKLKHTTYFTMTATPRSKEQGQRGITTVYDLNRLTLNPIIQAFQ
jgi:hypothetical protein